MVVHLAGSSIIYLFIFIECVCMCACMMMTQDILRPSALDRCCHSNECAQRALDETKTRNTTHIKNSIQLFDLFVRPCIFDRFEYAVCRTVCVRSARTLRGHNRERWTASHFETMIVRAYYSQANDHIIFCPPCLLMRMLTNHASPSDSEWWTVTILQVKCRLDCAGFRPQCDTTDKEPSWTKLRMAAHNAELSIIPFDFF